MHSEASPHLDPYRALLTPEGIERVFRSVLDRQGLSASGDEHPVCVEAVRVHEPPPREAGNAKALWTWIEVALSLSRRLQTAHYSLRFRVPWMSPSGTFLMGGWHYTPVVQLVPAPGLVVRAYDTPSGLARIVRADVIPERGGRLRFSARRELVGEGKDKVQLSVRIRYLGSAPEEEDREGATPTTGEADRQRRTAAGGRESRNRPGRGRRQTKTVDGDARLPEGWFDAAFPTPPELGKEGRKRFNRRLRLAGPRRVEPGSREDVTAQDLDAVLECVRNLAMAGDPSSAGDHHPASLENLRVLTIADHVRSGLRRALEDALDCVRREFGARERQRGNKDDDALWEDGFRGDEELLAVFERFVQASVEFFPRTDRGLVRVPNTPGWVRSAFADRRLVQLLDETNPIASLSHRRKVTRLGPGGVGRPDRASRADRDLDDTHKGKLCPFETPESEDIGLVLQLARGATIEDGRLKTAPKGNGEDRAEWLGWSASLVPFLPHNDSARVLMAAKSMKQALPLREPEIPLVRTGAEREIASMAGAAGDYRLRPTVAGTLAGEAVRPGVAGDVGRPGGVWRPAVLKGELALGRNLRVAYMPFNGLNFEDGIVLSRTAAEKLTSRHGIRIVVKLRSLVDGDCADEALHFGALKTDGARGTANHGRGAELDRWGVVKKGEMVAEGTELVRWCVLGRRWRRKPDRSAGGRNLIRRADGCYEYEVGTRRASADETGEVTRVRISGPQARGRRSRYGWKPTGRCRSATS